MLKIDNLQQLRNKYLFLLYAKCVASYDYFRKNYIFILHKVKGLIKFLPFEFQDDLSSALVNLLNIITLKSRQLGITTLLAIFSLWLTLFHITKTVVVMADTDDHAKGFIKKVKFSFKKLPLFLRMRTMYDNLHEIQFTNNSNIKAIPCTLHSGRSISCSLLIFDEMAFVKSSIMRNVWAAAKPTLSTGGMCAILSTPNGIGGLYYLLCMKAQSKLIDYRFFKFPWWLHPLRDQKWRDNEAKDMGAVKARQLYDCLFISALGHIIDGLKIELLLNKYMTEIFYDITSFENMIDKNIYNRLLLLDGLKLGRIFKMPEQGKLYILGSDVARGDGKDFSTILVLLVNTLLQCFLYIGQLSTLQFSHLIYTIGTLFNKSLVVVLNNNYGWAVLQHLLVLKYPNLFYSPKRLVVMVDLTNYTKDYLMLKLSLKVPGFTTSSTSRPLLLLKFRDFVLTLAVQIYSNRLYNLLKTWVWNNGRMDHMDLHHDDLIFAYALCLWVRLMYIILMRRRGKLKTKEMIDLMGLISDRTHKQLVLNDPFLRKNKNKDFNPLDWI